MLRLANREATKEWVRRRVRRYADLAGIGYTPRVVFTMDQYIALGGDRSIRRSHARVRGFADPEHRLILVNLDVHTMASVRGETAYVSRVDADDTAAHEIVHMRWTSADHDRAGVFERRTLALRSGIRCGAPYSPLPDAYKA
jgi:hypothetical protein